MDIEGLEKIKKELASKKESLLMIQEMMAEVSGDTRLQFLNIFDQMIKCYEDINDQEEEADVDE